MDHTKKKENIDSTIASLIDNNFSSWNDCKTILNDYESDFCKFAGERGKEFFLDCV